MAKGKKSTLEHMKNEINMGKIQNFLGSAITDISGYIKFSDTKVSIIMAALGVIIAGVINCRSIICDTYNSIPKCNYIQLLSWGIIILFLASTTMVYFWGLKTIMSHTSEVSFKSVWFIKESKEEYLFETYKKEIERMTPKDIVDVMAAELYKLNDINKQKISTTKKAIKAFSVTLISLFLGIVFCAIVNF